MANVYVVSTLTSSQAYTIFKNQDAEGRKIPRADRVVTVNGGHGVANSKSLITPQGVVTVITEEQAALLNDVPMFKRHEKRGFVKILKKKPDATKSSSDMKQADGSAPLKADDFGEGKAPTTGEDVEA